MQLKEIMTPAVEVVSPEASIREAAEKMRHLDIGPLPVCDGDRLVGMLTDRDITVRAVADGRDPVTTLVGEVMTPDIVYGFDDQDVQDATRLMEQYQIRRLPVLNRNKRLVGIVSLGDLAVHPGNQPLASEVLEQVSEPGKAGRKETRNTGRGTPARALAGPAIRAAGQVALGQKTLAPIRHPSTFCAILSQIQFCILSAISIRPTTETFFD
jgi:CBS domain-containing protein